MKIRKPLLFPLLGLLALISLFSCGEDRWKEYYPLTERDLWMDSLMREVYLWYEDIPAAKSLNYFQTPEAFLKSILSKNDKGFSTVDTLMEIPLPSYGFDYTLYKIATSDTTYQALVSYVAKNSPAEDAGLERGNWIMLVDGDSITRKTEEKLKRGDARTLHVGKYVIVEHSGNEGESTGNTGSESDAGAGTNDNEEDNETAVIREIGNFALPAARPVAVSAVHSTRFVQLEGTDDRIAYLAYNSFTAGTAENPELYNNELRAFAQTCKQSGVNQLVLDLRYNPGGELKCVQLLASMLVPAEKLGSPLAFLQYNDKQSARNRDLLLDSQLLPDGTNLNLSTVYIITSQTTAGAAEMLINCLRPYMKVVLIGGTTRGEYVATESFTNRKHAWVLRPVVCEVFNAQGEADYLTGFRPDISVNETSYLPYYLPLGDPDEILFNTALGVIAGAIELPKSTMHGMPVKSFVAPRSVRRGLIIK